MLIDTNQLAEALIQRHEWGRAIVQAYMGWYVFFVAGNIAMLGWIHTRRVLKATKEAMLAFKFIAQIVAFLNAGGIVSSSVILWYLNKLVHADHPLIIVIFVAGIANTLVLVALLMAWIQVLRKQTYRTVSIET
jgi:hypothetical protein